jgi:5-methyltetrahydrofolate--homocysteine methyltransferase
VRPAPGYPTQPDHTEKAKLWKLLDVKNQIGVDLTESYAMLPAASVSAMVFGSPDSHYFAVGKISKDQLTEYAGRKNMEFAAAQTALNHSLSYDPDYEDEAN